VDAFGSTRRRKQLAGREGAAVHAGALGGAAAVQALLAAAGERAAAGAATKAGLSLLGPASSRPGGTLPRLWLCRERARAPGWQSAQLGRPLLCRLRQEPSALRQGCRL